MTYFTEKAKRYFCYILFYSYLENFSEASPITDFCFCLTFTIKYYFYYMGSSHLACSFYGYRLFAINPLSANPTKWSNTLKQTIRRQKPTNCLSVFDHFVELAR